ncbi:MAG: hypothetical protein JSU06_19675 [Actinobacteria bacterium]|nr:hypothetical protein [Actinomycetota bacterium]
MSAWCQAAGCGHCVNRSCHCGCGESIAHLCERALFLNDTHRNRAENRRRRERKLGPKAAIRIVGSKTWSPAEDRSAIREARAELERMRTQRQKRLCHPGAVSFEGHRDLEAVYRARAATLYDAMRQARSILEDHGCSDLAVAA